MFKFLLALHLLFAIFAIGPLVQAATTAGRAVRKADAAAAAASVRMLKIYAYTSVLVVVAGMALMSADSPVHKGAKVGQIGDLWIWLSLVLWLLGVALVLAVLVPSLTKVGVLIGAQQPASGLTARVAATGGIVGVIFTVIVFLMVYRPGG